MAKLTVEEIVASLKEYTALELNDLKKAIEENQKFDAELSMYLDLLPYLCMVLLCVPLE